jgi:hypothetical protein
MTSRAARDRPARDDQLAVDRETFAEERTSALADTRELRRLCDDLIAQDAMRSEELATRQALTRALMEELEAEARRDMAAMLESARAVVPPAVAAGEAALRREFSSLSAELAQRGALSHEAQVAMQENLRYREDLAAIKKKYDKERAATAAAEARRLAAEQHAAKTAAEAARRVETLEAELQGAMQATELVRAELRDQRLDGERNRALSEQVAQDLRAERSRSDGLASRVEQLTLALSRQQDEVEDAVDTAAQSAKVEADHARQALADAHTQMATLERQVSTLAAAARDERSKRDAVEDRIASLNQELARTRIALEDERDAHTRTRNALNDRIRL